MKKVVMVIYPWAVLFILIFCLIGYSVAQVVTEVLGAIAKRLERAVEKAWD